MLIYIINILFSSLRAIEQLFEAIKNENLKIEVGNEIKIKVIDDSGEIKFEITQVMK